MDEINETVDIDPRRILKDAGSQGDLVAHLQKQLSSLGKQSVLHYAILRHLPVSLFVKDEQSRFVFVNEAFARQVGRVPEQLVGKTDHEIAPPQLAEKYRRDDERVLRNRQPATFIEPNESVQGRRWVEVTKAPIYDDAGRTVAILGMFTDVTERVEAENKLKQSTQLLQSILDNSPAVIHVRDHAGRFIIANRQYEKVFRVPPGAWKGKTPFEIFPEIDANAYVQNDQLAREAGRPVKVEETSQIDGTERTFLSLKFPIIGPDGVEYGIGGISTDITERIRAEQERVKSEELFRQVWNQSFDGMRVTDENGLVLQVNEAFCRMVGMEAHQMIGKPFTIIYAESIRHGMIERYRAKLNKQAIGQSLERELELWNGRKVWLELTNTILRIENEAVRMMSVMRNVTDRKRAEEALTRQAEQLVTQAEELENRNQELVKAYAGLKETEAQLIQSEKMAAVGLLVAGLAHEINNPASFVLTNLATITRDLQDHLNLLKLYERGEADIERTNPRLAQQISQFKDDYDIESSAEEIPELLDSAKRGMQRIRDLVTNLRAHSRIDTRSKFEMGDFKTGIESCLVILKPITPKHVEVWSEIPDDFPMVECAFGQINQVFMNLIVNAIHAVGDLDRPGKVCIQGKRVDDGVLISVRDNGPGIPVEHQSRIFDAFFTTKDVGKGTGLGLSIARRIIDAHHGRLEFTSNATGTEFRVWLPIHQHSISDTPIPITDSSEFESLN